MKQFLAKALIILNFLWAGSFLGLALGYRFLALVSWYSQYPAYVLFINIVIGVVGVLVGSSLLKDRISIRLAVMIEVPLAILSCFIMFAD